MSHGFTSAWWEARQAIAGTQAPRREPKAETLERDIQNEIAAFLDGFGSDCYYVWHRMDQPTTCREGTPDFVGCLRGTPFAIEVKRRGNKVAPEQAGELLRVKLAGGQSVAVWSLAEAVEFVREIIK